MSLIGQAIGEVLARGLAPALLAHGYRKHGRLWWRPDPRAVPMVIVEVEKDVRTNVGRFTFDLALHFPQVARALGAPPVDQSPRARDATLRINIARAAGSAEPPDPIVIREDTAAGPTWWWQPTPASDPAPLAASVERVWHRFAAPWFERHRELPAALATLIDQKQWWIAAAAALVLGDRDNARQFAHCALADAHPHRQRAIRQWLAHHQLA